MSTLNQPNLCLPSLRGGRYPRVLGERCPPSRCKQVFFSYGHDSNRVLVDRFKGDLEKRGHRVWIDYKEIGTWEDWRGRITRGLQDSDLAVAYLSKHATRDPGVCRNEIALALDRFHTIYPVLLEPESEVTPPATITHIQWQDLSRWRDIKAGKVPDTDWSRWYAERLIELIELIEGEASHFAGEIDTLSQVLQPQTFESDIAPHIPDFTGRRWVFDAYQEWLEKQKNSRLFWLKGGPGIGKTALAAHLVHHHAAAIVGAWFCRADSRERRDPTGFITTLAFQLATRWPDYRVRLLPALDVRLLATPQECDTARVKLHQRWPNDHDLFHHLIEKPLHGLIWRENKLVVVIDALDEAADEQGNNPIVELIAGKLKGLPEWLGFVVTSRPNPDVVNRLSGFAPFELDAADPRNRDDLREWLEQALAARAKLNNLPAERRRAITAALLEHSAGMILYLRQALEAFDGGTLDAAGLRDTPPGLGALYTLQFDHRFPDRQRDYDEGIRPLLRLLLAAPGPLAPGLARAVLGEDREAWQRHRDRLGSYGLDTPRGLSLFHSTLAEWLHDEAAGNYRIDPTDARKALAATLWRDFEQADGRGRITWPEQVGTWLPELIHTLPQGADSEALSRLGLFVQKSLLYYPEAEPFYQRALAIREKALGPEHPGVATGLNNLAVLYDNQGRYAEAEPLYQRALAIWEKAFGPEHPDVASSLNNLGELYRVQGRYAEAEPLYQRALAIWEKAFGSEHPTVATGLNNLAALYDNQGRYAEAEPLYQRALAIREKALEPEHPNVASSLNNLAALYLGQGRYAEAEPLYQRALAISEKTLGPEHTDVATSLNNLGALYQAQGRYAEAEPLYQRVLAIREKALGSEHPTVAGSLNNLAGLYRDQGCLEEAEPLYQRTVRIFVASLGMEHPHTQVAINNLCATWKSRGLHEATIQARLRALLSSQPT